MKNIKWLSYVGIKNKISLSSSIQKIVAALILFIVSCLCTLNVYVMHASPVWDGVIYNNLISSYISGGYLFGSIDTSGLIGTQIGASYANRILYFFSIGFLQNLTGFDLRYIYPVYNTLFAFLTSYFLFKICHESFDVSYVFSIVAGVWFLINPNVLLINHVLAHPELLMTTFVVMAYYFYRHDRVKLSALCIFFGVLSKQAAAVAGVFILTDIIFSSCAIRDKISKIIIVSLAVALAALLPILLIDNSRFHFEITEITDNIIKTHLNGQLFESLLYNFGVLWVLFFAGLPLFNKRFNYSVAIVFSVGMVLSLIGSTDWWRTWFSILFFIVIPVSTKALDSVTSEKGMESLRGIIAFSYTLLIVLPRPYFSFDSMQNPSFLKYTLAVALFLFAYIVRFLNLKYHFPFFKDRSTTLD